MRRSSTGWKVAVVKIIVIGAGKVGFEIALRLSQVKHDIVVVDKDAASLQEVAAHLDVMTITGNGASPFILEQAGINNAQIVIAVTEIDEVNMIACMTAKQYGVPTCVARIRNPEYTSNNPRGLSLQKLGIDLIIDPERLAALEISRLLKTPLASDVEYFADGQVSMIGLEVDAAAKIVGRKLAECHLRECLLVAIEREDGFIIPRGDTMVRAHDRIYVIGKTGHFHAIRDLVGKPDQQIRHVAIVGAGRIGRNVVHLLATKHSGLSLTLFEKDLARADAAARQFPHILVIKGDATKIDVLREEGGMEFDALVAVSGEDHVNLLATMLAKELGIREVIAKISREDYAPLAGKAGADAVVVPRLLTISSVLHLVRQSQIVSIALLGGGAETMEFIVSSGCPLIGKPLKAIDFPRRAIIGAILHDGEVIIARGDSVIHPQDRVIVFALPEAVSDVTAIFRDAPTHTGRPTGWKPS
jgi:trk system potassium uptake protein TrkA